MNRISPIVLSAALLVSHRAAASVPAITTPNPTLASQMAQALQSQSSTPVQILSLDMTNLGSARTIVGSQVAPALSVAEAVYVAGVSGRWIMFSPPGTTSKLVQNNVLSIFRREPFQLLFFGAPMTRALSPTSANGSDGGNDAETVLSILHKTYPSRVGLSVLCAQTLTLDEANAMLAFVHGVRLPPQTFSNADRYLVADVSGVLWVPHGNPSQKNLIRRPLKIWLLS